MSANQGNQENASFYDQADQNFSRAVNNAQGGKGSMDQDKLAKGIGGDNELDEDGSQFSANLMGDAEEEVRENEDASLQDDSYSFDEENTDNEEYHDADDDLNTDTDEDIDFDNDEDYIQ